MLGCVNTRRLLARASATRLASPLLGESRRAASPLPSPAILAFAPVPFVGLFVPLVPVVSVPARRRIAAPFPPVCRRHPVVADWDLENRRRNAPWFDHRPRTVPGLPDIPSATLKGPVLMAVEEHVRGGTGRIVDRHSGHDDESGRSRQLNPNVDPHLCLPTRDDCHENHRLSSLHRTAARTERCGEGLKNAVRGLQRPPNRPRRRSALCSPPR